MTPPLDLGDLLREIAEQDPPADVMARLRTSSRDRRGWGAVAVIVVAALVAAAVAVPLWVTSGRHRSGLTDAGTHMTVIGYKTVPKFSTHSHGPVRVSVSGRQAEKLEDIVGGLGGQATACYGFAPAPLYRIEIPATGGRPAETVTGVACGAGVTISGGGRVVTHRDATCSLIDAVRAVLPSTARPTQNDAVGCTP